ncbi:alpha/beta-hydrolase [Periconia macrospinosa]|uniref:Alpha/beta-hydrolase n=1 Tax=Periconia macrospinosa TaxID=97972 RepID=A0A2V1E2A3_9PLEO|nr:alpha/beta-hydrolase [Periconia macrospinosa]
MALSIGDLVLPRPGQNPILSQPPIPGPTEAVFAETFGTLLPPAQYIQTNHGKAAYYEILPSSPAPTSKPPHRVLLIHGVQTPALGLYPLTRLLQTSFPNAHFVLIDLWGHGLSDTPQVPHDQPLFHSLIDSLLTKLQWPSAHLIGYSFGGALTASYVNTRPSLVQSFTLLAPAGLIPSATTFTPEEHVHLRGGADEIAAHKWVHSWLEGGGEIDVPSDWKDHVARGEVVAAALRKWQLTEHHGHAASVVGVFRDAGVMDRDEDFKTAAQTGIPSLVVLGETDSICSEGQLRGLGFERVFVVEGAGHGLVRDKPEEVKQVAGHIEKFWEGIS